MTDIQFKNYLNNITGSRVHFKATVYQVDKDGEVYLSAMGGGFFDQVLLDGLPNEIALKLNKNQVIEFDATLREFTDFIVFSVTVDDPVVYSIQ